MTGEKLRERAQAVLRRLRVRERPVEAVGGSRAAGAGVEAGTKGESSGRA